MAYSGTAETEQEQYLIDDATSSSHEKNLERDLAAVFLLLLADFKAQFAFNGTIVDMEEFRASLEAALGKSYRRVMKHFIKSLYRQLEEEIDIQAEDATAKERAMLELRKESSDEMWLVALIFIRRKIKEDATYILETTRKVIQKQIEKATITLLTSTDNPQDITTKQVSVLASEGIKKRNAVRARMISESEVLIAGNKASQIESEILAGAIRNRQRPSTEVDPLIDTELKKRWITRRDDLVRRGHRRVHGQTQPITHPFIVMNELLMTPKDSSLGATGKNIHGCRCRSYTIWS
jgi:hypothetical protein